MDASEERTKIPFRHIESETTMSSIEFNFVEGKKVQQLQAATWLFCTFFALPFLPTYPTYLQLQHLEQNIVFIPGSFLGEALWLSAQKVPVLFG